MSADRWTFFDKLARRTLGDGSTDAEALGVIREHMRPLPATFWPASTDAEALERIAAIRDTLPPERTEAEASGMLVRPSPRTVAWPLSLRGCTVRVEIGRHCAERHWKRYAEGP